MLCHTFKHAPKVTAQVERLIWRAGITGWDQLLVAREVPGMTRAGLEQLKSYIALSKVQLWRENLFFFANALKRRDYWRLFHEFRKEVVFLDIETTGFSQEKDDITCVALWDGRKAKSFVRGFNLDLDKFTFWIEDYKIIVTFNGASFDLPFLKHKLGFHPTHLHLDLLHETRSLGYKGGLKAIEAKLGIARDDPGIADGLHAADMWFEYKFSGRLDALKKLSDYNMQDARNLEKVLVHVYNEKAKQLEPFGIHERVEEEQP